MSIPHLLTFLKRVLSLCLIYTTSRLAFYLYNFKGTESTNTLLAFLEGLRFDISAILYINLPLLVLLCVHFFVPQLKLFNRFINGLFYLVNIPFILLNNIDIVFYVFNLKRSTIDFFDFITTSDVKNVYLNYLIDYWQISLLSCLQIVFLLSLKNLPLQFKRQKSAFIILILTSASVVIGLRGGTQLKPIKPINAGVISSCNTPELVLNTPFTILHSYNQNSLEALRYFEEGNQSIHSNRHLFNSDGLSHENVVVIILESFSKEFVGYYNDDKGYTPFLDSLMQSGLAVHNAYANGVRSIEALPAITASIPSLMTEPFITSSYANNSYPSLANILADEGYSTSFFHGGEKGTMGFYEFSKKAGFAEYYGKEKYNNNADYDNNWGIYDEPFLTYFAQQLNKEKKPFLSVFFSLTSHPPYQLPKKYENHFPKGDLDIHESIGYSDNALRIFFKTAQQMDWFDNTLFVITADHTSPLSSNKLYKNKVGRYAVPMLFWRSDHSIQGKIENTSQHIDILPTVMDILGYEKEFFSFGKSILKQEDWAISFLKNEYLMLTNEAYLVNKDEVYTTYKDKKFKETIPNNQELVNKLKAIKQSFNNAMITNQMRVNEN